MSHGFSGGKQAIKLPSVRNRGQFVVYSGQQRIRNFHLKDDNGKLWVEVIIVTLFGCCSDRRCFYSKQKWRKSCRYLNCTFCMTIKSSSRFDRIGKINRDYTYWQILSLVCLLKHRVTFFYPIGPKARATMARIVFH